MVGAKEAINGCMRANRLMGCTSSVASHASEVKHAPIYFDYSSCSADIVMCLQKREPLHSMLYEETLFAAMAWLTTPFHKLYHSSLCMCIVDFHRAGSRMDLSASR